MIYYNAWKTAGFDSNGLSQEKFDFVDHRGDFDKNVTLAQVKNSSTNQEIRYINPAIYTESIGENQSENSYKEDSGCNEALIDGNNCDLSVSASNLVGKDTNADHENEQPGRNTYRCYSTSALPLESFSVWTEISSGSTSRVERRCKINSIPVDYNRTIIRDKCITNSPRVMQISTTSLSVQSNDHRALNGSDLGSKRLTHLEWMRKKSEAMQRAKKEEEHAAKIRQEEAERSAREKDNRTRLEKERLVKWLERKKQEELDKKAALEKELRNQKIVKELERILEGANLVYRRQWSGRKKHEQKTQRKELEIKQKKIDEEREKRLEQSTKAYEKWRENSKNKPKPATQGLLPHQNAKPAYVNPIPWQSIMENSNEKSEKNTFREKQENINRGKMSGRKTVAIHQ
ncbi:hypothetical protein PUN28_003892 [Cardiocondyla obscurior]